MSGGSQNTSNSYDPMASFMSAYTGLKADQRADQLWTIYQNDFLPYDQKAIQANTELLGAQKDLALQELEYNTQLNPVRAQATKVGLEQAVKDIQDSQPLKDAQRKQQLAEIVQSAPLSEKFYKQALEGAAPQYEQRMGEATADVAQAYQTAAGDAAREAGRLGIDPNSGRFAAMLGGLTSSRAKDTAFARTQARNTERARVEDVGFNRLATGMQVANQAKGGSWASDYGPSAMGGMPYQGGVSSFNITNNPLTASQGYSQMAGNTFNSLASRVQSSTTTSNDGGSGALSAIAGLGGALGGAYLLRK